jgi:hypothetical protein
MNKDLKAMNGAIPFEGAITFKSNVPKEELLSSIFKEYKKINWKIGVVSEVAILEDGRKMGTLHFILLVIAGIILAPSIILYLFYFNWVLDYMAEKGKHRVIIIRLEENSYKAIYNSDLSKSLLTNILSRLSEIKIVTVE